MIKSTQIGVFVSFSSFFRLLGKYTSKQFMISNIRNIVAVLLSPLLISSQHDDKKYTLKVGTQISCVTEYV